MKTKFFKVAAILLILVSLFSVADSIFHIREKASEYAETKIENQIDSFFEDAGI